MTEQDQQAKKAAQKEFGRRMRALRTDRGWTQEQMAEYTGLSSDGVRRLEYGHYNPSLATLKKVSKGLGISIGVLLDPELDSEDVLAAFIRGLPVQLRGVAFSQSSTRSTITRCRPARAVCGGSLRGWNNPSSVPSWPR